MCAHSKSTIEHKPKQSRPRRRKAVTIVAGFKCEGGVVLCADTQETAQDIKLWVEKLSLYKQDWCQAGFGGSGHGDMVEMLVQRIKAELDKGYDSLTEVRDCIRLALREGYEHEIRHHPDPPEEKVVTLLLAIRPRAEQRMTLFKSTGPVLLEIPEYEVVGVGELVRYIAKNLYRPGLPISQAVVLGVHLVSLAKKYVDSVGGDTHVLVLTSDGRVNLERKEFSQKQEEFFEQFNEALKDLMLSCPDTSICNEEVFKKLAVFIEEITKLRIDYHRDMMNDESLKQALSGEGAGRRVFEVSFRSNDTTRFSRAGIRLAAAKPRCGACEGYL